MEIKSENFIFLKRLKLFTKYIFMITIFFHSFQVNNMIFFMFWPIFCDKEGLGGIFITMNDSSHILLGHRNQFFKTVICNSQHAFELFGNGSWVFQNDLNPGASQGLRPPGHLTKASPWTHRGSCWPPASFSGFQLWAIFTSCSLSWYYNHIFLSRTCLWRNNYVYYYISYFLLLYFRAQYHFFIHFDFSCLLHFYPITLNAGFEHHQVYKTQYICHRLLFRRV